jgi:hypothetical protein
VGSGEAATVVAEKHFPSRFGADQLGSGGIEVALDGFLRDRPEKNEAFLFSFSDDPSATSWKVELLDPQGENFRSPQPGRLKKFKESAVAKSERGFGRGGFENPPDLVCGEGGGEFAGEFWGAESDRHAGGGSAHPLEVGSKTAENRCFQPKRGGPDSAGVATIGKKIPEVIRTEAPPIFFGHFTLHPLDQTFEEFPLDGLGAEGVSPFHRTGGEKILDGALIQRTHDFGRKGSDPVRSRQASR